MSDYTDEQIETIQAVVDRVSSWQDGAPEGTVAQELTKGFDEAGIAVPEHDQARLADAIQDAHGEVKAAEVLGP
ncbi:hypothetical protein [Nocardioides zeae]